MPTRGLRGRGFSIDNLMLGGGNTDTTISTPSCVHGVSGFASLYASPQDIMVRNLTINSQLIPVAYSSGSGSGYFVYKILASGKITLGTGGIIRCDGGIPAGDHLWTNDSGCIGFQGPFQYGGGSYQSTVGGSGSGGSSAGGGGSPGWPTGSRPNDALTYFGGAGGNGAGGSGTAGGFNLLNWTISNGSFVINPFSPSVYLDGIVYSNTDGSNGSYPTNGYFLRPYVINGGGGGGGSGTFVSGQGGGGCGGGVCFIKCDTLILGPNGTNIFAAGGGSTGGGGAGGGGVVIIVASDIVWGTNAIISVQGGLTSGGLSTQNGQHGRVLIFSNNLVASFDTSSVSGFNGAVTKAMYDAAVLAYNS